MSREISALVVGRCGRSAVNRLLFKPLTCLLALVVSASCLADRPILLVTPQGIYQAEVTNGVPGPWRAVEMDVIVRGFDSPTPGPGPGPTPPPVDDPIVKQVTEITKATLSSKEEATAAAAIVDSLSKMGLTGADFKRALEMSIPIADSSLKSDGRLVSWSKQVLLVTTDAAKIQAGTKAAFGISAATIEAISAAAANPEQPIAETSPAFDFAMIIAIIQAIMALLKQLGII